MTEAGTVLGSCGCGCSVRRWPTDVQVSLSPLGSVSSTSRITVGIYPITDPRPYLEDSGLSQRPSELGDATAAVVPSYQGIVVVVVVGSDQQGV